VTLHRPRLSACGQQPLNEDGRGHATPKTPGTALRRGFAWTTLAQVFAAITSLALVPFVVGRLGIAAYGVLTLANSTLTLSQFLDGGMVNTTTRYAGLAIGAHDRTGLTRAVATSSVVALSIAGALGAALFVLAPTIVGLFHINARLHPPAIYAARIVAIMLPLGLLQGVLTGVLTAASRFGALASVSISSRIAYVGSVVALLGHVGGIATMLRILLAVQCGSLLLTAGLCLPLLKMSELRLLPRSAVREMAVYSVRIQAFYLSGIVNLQADTFIVGAVLPIRYVGLFGIGASIVNQVRTVATNVSGPIVSRLTNTLGAAGRAAALAEYQRLQRIWAVWTTGYVSVTVGAIGFCVHAWLGSRLTPAAIVATILLAGWGVNLLTVPLGLFLQAIGRPEIQLRYGLLSAGLNLILTVAFLWVGIYGITGGTAVGVALGSLILIPLARAGVSRDLPGLFEAVPWRAGIAALTSSAAAAILIVTLLPVRGDLGLILAGLATGPGALVFVTMLLGPHGARRAVNDAVRTRSVTPLMSAMSARVAET
jgi:O-antigen/teichoic acid export membrane protein